jgi:hypothetical protein
MNKYNIVHYKNSSSFFTLEHNNNYIDDYDYIDDYYYILFGYRSVNRIINHGYFGISLCIRRN